MGTEKVFFDQYDNKTAWTDLLSLASRNPATLNLLKPRRARQALVATHMSQGCVCGQMNFPLAYSSVHGRAKYKCTRCYKKYTCNWIVSWIDNKPVVGVA